MTTDAVEILKRRLGDSPEIRKQVAEEKAKIDMLMRICNFEMPIILYRGSSCRTEDIITEHPLYNMLEQEMK